MTRTTEIIVECKHLHSFFLVQLLFNLGDTMMSAIKRQKVASALKSRFIAVHCTEKHHLKSNLNMKDNITRLNFFMWTYLIFHNKIFMFSHFFKKKIMTLHYIITLQSGGFSILNIRYACILSIYVLCFWWCHIFTMRRHVKNILQGVFFFTGPPTKK